MTGTWKPVKCLLLRNTEYILSALVFMSQSYPEETPPPQGPSPDQVTTIPEVYLQRLGDGDSESWHCGCFVLVRSLPWGAVSYLTAPLVLLATVFQ